jgi:hypothetical protein
MMYRLFGALLVTAITVGCAGPSVVLRDFGPEKTIHYSQLKDVGNLSDYAVYLDEGDTIPVRLNLDSDLFDLSTQEVGLVLKKRLYFRVKVPEGVDLENASEMSERDKQKLLKQIKVYLSLDGKTWAPYTDMKAVNRVLGLKGGSFSVGMGMTKEEGVQIFINVKINRMKEAS